MHVASHWRLLQWLRDQFYGSVALVLAAGFSGSLSTSLRTANIGMADAIEIHHLSDVGVVEGWPRRVQALRRLFRECGMS